MTVHRRLTTNNDEITSSNDATNDDVNDDISSTTLQLDTNQNITTKSVLEIGDTSSRDAIMEGEDDEDIDDLVDDLQRDVESLLSRTPSNKLTRNGSKCCQYPYKVGNCTVLFPALYVRTGLGVVGPHWIGLITTFLLVSSGSLYFLHKAMHVGPITLTLTSALTLLCTLSLMRVGLADPGIINVDNNIPVTKSNSSNQKNQLTDCKWCDICNVVQPSHAVHCPECNLCIAHYDHHCPWMGTCVGENNFRAFVVFNCSWITYLIFGLSWIASLQPIN